MEILTAVVMTVVAGLAGLWLGAKLSGEMAGPALEQTLRSLAQDRSCYLTVLRREIANHLIWHDPARFQRLYELTLAEVDALQDLAPSAATSRLQALMTKYPFYSDFDHFGRRDYVLFVDMWGADLEKCEEVYRELATFQVLSGVVDPHWRQPAIGMPVSRKEREHLVTYVQQLQDTKLCLDVDEAMHEYYSNEVRRAADGSFESRRFTVRRLDHFAETRYGVHVKATNEYAIYSVFHFDESNADDSPKISEGYYRSDQSFGGEIHLDGLFSVIDWRRSPSGRG